MTHAYEPESIEEPERDWHQEYKDDLAQGYIYPDGSPRDPEPPDDAYESHWDAPAEGRKVRRWRTTRRRPEGLALRIGPLELTVRRRPTVPCGACSGRGWFHTKGTLNPVPAPEGYDGVALCGCGTAHDQLNDTWRNMRRRDRKQRNQPPF